MIATKDCAKAFQQWLNRREQRIGNKYRTALHEAVGADPSDDLWSRLYKTAVSADRATQVGDDLLLTVKHVRLSAEIAEMVSQEAKAKRELSAAMQELRKHKRQRPEDAPLREQARDAERTLERLRLARAELGKLNVEHSLLFGKG